MEQPAGNKITGNPSSHPALSVKWVEDFPDIPLNRNEAYKLRVTSKGVEIEAITETGVYRAIQTLRQLTEKKGNGIAITGCEITDWPAFRIRGFMQDVGRTYISTDELKREIAILARYKINVFHWHLTENQAWRLQSKVFPMLNDSVNTTRQPGKYYTLEEARELAAFCKQHHVLLIPEIDMPGHSAAFVRTFRHDMQSPEGMKILKLLIDEVCETFDVPYLHIGTDEVQFTNPDFVPEMVAYVRSKGKKVISWNPGWHYKPGEIDMTHLWSYRGKAQKGIPAIDSRFHYLNHFDTFADLFALYYLGDPKLVELGLLDNPDAYKAEYYKYMLNGLMTQLMRIEPGKDVEEAHMRNRKLIAEWALEKGKPDNVVELVSKDGKTYVRINDYARLRDLFGQLLGEIQRIKSEGDYEAGRNLVETYAVKVDPKLHKEVLDRYSRLDIAPYRGFVNPVYVPVRNDKGAIVDVKVTYGEDYLPQVMRYSREYKTLSK